jgi:hypothetical protein
MPTPRLVSLANVRTLDPEWPFSPWATGNLVRRGLLGCIRVGRRIFLTREHLDEFVRAHHVDSSHPSSARAERRTVRIALPKPVPGAPK